MDIFLSEYAFMVVLWQVVQKLCVEKKGIPPGLSIEILRYIYFGKIINQIIVFWGIIIIFDLPV